MTLIPTQNYILIRERSIKKEGNVIQLPANASPLQPYGEVISVGPDCKFTKPGDKVVFIPSNMVAGFDEGKDEKFIVSEDAVFGKYIPSVDSASEVLQRN